MNVARFRRIVRAVLVSSVAPAALVACSGSETEMPDQASCADLKSDQRYGALTLAPGVDGVAFATRGETPYRSEDDTTPLPASRRIGEIGAVCATAGDRAGCLAKVDALLLAEGTAGWEVTLTTCGGCVRSTITDLGVVTRGDDVRVATLDELVAAAAPIDGRDEAATVLQLRQSGAALDCGEDNARLDKNGWTFKKTDSYCDGRVVETFTTVTREGAVAAAGEHVVEKGDNGCIEGRRPANLAPSHGDWLSSLPACFGEIAHMEAAAVLAFDELAAQLRALGAPTPLLFRIAKARQDEVHHAAATARLAERFGAEVRAPQVLTAQAPVAPGERLLLRVALENAVEGCVREAFGALVAAHQGAHAEDPEVRRLFTRIAEDEANHAELSFALDGWLMARLDPRERALVAQAREQAWRGLELACAAEPSPEVVAVAGLPCAADAVALLAELRWADADLAA